MKYPGNVTKVGYTVPLKYNDKEIGTAEVNRDQYGYSIEVTLNSELPDDVREHFIDAISFQINGLGPVQAFRGKDKEDN